MPLSQSASGHSAIRRRLHVLSLIAALLMGPGTALADEKVWLDLEAPLDGSSILGPIGLVEVRGWTGTGVRGKHDVVIVLDRSMSAWYPSGADVDGDGRIGVMRRRRSAPAEYPFWTTDAGDTIFQAELSAARKLIERMDPESTRMALISFGGHATLRAGLESSRIELLRGLAQIPAYADWQGTHLSGAIKTAVAAFGATDATPLADSDRHRSLILLSDGLPTVPGPVENAEIFAVQAARYAARSAVKIYAFALGPEAASRPHIFEQIVRETRGELFLVHQPADVIDYVPNISLSEIAAVEIENVGTGERARAVRLFPDGTFDGYAPLRPGENLVRVTAIGEAGGRTSDEIHVTFHRIQARGADQLAAAERLLKDLKIRTLETELSERARRKLARQRSRRLELEVER